MERRDNNVRKQCRQGNFHNVVCIDLAILLLYFAFLNMFDVFLTFIPRSPLVLSNNDLLDSDIRGLSRVILNFVIPKIANIARNTEHT